MPDAVTVTAKNGPAIQVTSQLYTAPRSVNVNFFEQTLTIVDSNGIVHNFDYNVVATVTWTVSSHVATVAFS